MGFSSSSSIRGDGTSGSATYKQFYKNTICKIASFRSGSIPSRPTKFFHKVYLIPLLKSCGGIAPKACTSRKELTRNVVECQLKYGGTTIQQK